MEHYCQSHRFSAQHAEYRELIRHASTTNKAKILARQQMASEYKWRVELDRVIEQHLRLGVRVRAGWAEARDAVMFRGLQAKFEQHSQPARLLLGTGERVIVERSPRHAYGVVGGTGVARTGWAIR